MRISDWSSDVCSSDLPHLSLEREAPHALVLALAVHQRAEDGVAIDARDASPHKPRRAVDERADLAIADRPKRSEEHTSELQSLMRISYAVFCLKKKNKARYRDRNNTIQNARHQSTDPIQHTQITPSDYKK